MEGTGCVAVGLRTRAGRGRLLRSRAGLRAGAEMRSPVLVLVLVLLLAFPAPALSEGRAFDGVVVDARGGNRVQPLKVRAADGREKIFWQSPTTRYGGLRPFPGMPVRVSFTPDLDPGFGSAKEVRLRADPGSPLATLDQYLLFHPRPGEVKPESTIGELAKRYPFLSQRFLRDRFFPEGRYFWLYYDTFPEKVGILISKEVTGNRARLLWEGWVTGSEVGEVFTRIHYGMVREGGRWRVEGERMESSSSCLGGVNPTARRDHGDGSSGRP